MPTALAPLPAQSLSPKSGARRYAWLAIALFLLHAGLMLYRYGQLPVAPVLLDEVIINDAAVSLGLGQGYAARSFTDSAYGIDHLFAHFPPLYPLTESLAIRAFGFSVYSLRLTTTAMSIAEAGIFLWLLYLLVRRSLLDWTTAGLTGALFCCFAPLMIRERMARMEAMIEVLILLCLLAILLAATEPEGRRARLCLVGAGLFAGLAMAVHPEAISALLLLAPLMLFAAPGQWLAKSCGVVLTVIAPLAIWLATFGRQSAAAFREFREILKRATPTDPGIAEWLRGLAHVRALATAERDLLFLTVLVLLLLAPLTYVFRARHLPDGDIRRRLMAWFATGAILELVVIEWGLGVNSNRYGFLVGPLLIACVMGAKESRMLSRRQVAAGCLIVCLEITVLGVYLHVRRDRQGQMNPNRFMPIVRSLPPGASVACSPLLWLDLRESGRPFTLLYDKFDGVNRWKGETGNPLDRFDDVILSDADDSEFRQMEVYAASGRRETTYFIGGKTLYVYRRTPDAGK